MMHISDFDYELQADLDRADAAPKARRFAMLYSIDARKPGLIQLPKNSLVISIQRVVVVNNSRVIPARLTGHRDTGGGHVEIFLVRQIETNVWGGVRPPRQSAEKRLARAFRRWKTYCGSP